MRFGVAFVYVVLSWVMAALDLRVELASDAKLERSWCPSWDDG